MKVLITGANGMVARAAADYCRSVGDVVIPLPRAEMDISDAARVDAIFDQYNPDAVLNCAAYTDVDGAESNKEAAVLANATGVENLAIAARRQGSRFLTISTDYVFNGANQGFYTQRDTPDPQSTYAQTKYQGERMALNAYGRSVVVRSGWIYGPHGTNFLSVMPRLLSDQKRIKAIVNSYGTPTYAGDLARRLRELIDLDMPGTFHVTNAGPGTSYLEFAQAICDAGEFDKSLIESINHQDLKRPAPRPVSSKLACLFSEKFGLGPLPEWRLSLAAFVDHELTST